MPQNETQKKKFVFEGKEFIIDNSGKVRSFADLDERTNTIFIDSSVPEKFFEGLAVHEIEERRLIKLGHSYQHSHNEAQKKELAFYEQKFGKEKGMEMLKEEERLVLRPIRMKFLTAEEMSEAGIQVEVQTIWIRAIIYEGETYIIDNSQKLVNAIVDFWEKGRVIYIDQDIPERFFEGLAIYQIEERKLVKKGYSYTEARSEAIKKEIAFYESEFNSRGQALKMLEEEGELMVKKYEEQRKELKNGEHKVVYEKGEILPK